MTDFAARRVMMVDTQVRPNDVTKYPIIAAMLAVPREEFVPEARREVAYVGENLDLGDGRVVLEPRTLAKMLDAIDIQTGDTVLDVGCGLGYSTAIAARMAEAVIAVEEDEMLAAQAQARLSAQGADNAVVVVGVMAEGSAKNAPYDAILIGGAVQTVPSGLMDQLKEGGRIAAIFMDGALGVCRVGHKIDGQISWRAAFNATAPVLPGFAARRGFTL